MNASDIYCQDNTNAAQGLRGERGDTGAQGGPGSYGTPGAKGSEGPAGSERIDISFSGYKPVEQVTTPYIEVSTGSYEFIGYIIFQGIDVWTPSTLSVAYGWDTDKLLSTDKCSLDFKIEEAYSGLSKSTVTIFEDNLGSVTLDDNYKDYRGLIKVVDSGLDSTNFSTSTKMWAVSAKTVLQPTNKGIALPKARIYSLQIF